MCAFQLLTLPIARLWFACRLIAKACLALLPPHSAGTPELVQHGGADNGLTSYSLDLDEFERPPELQAGEPVQQEQQQQEQEQLAEPDEAMELAEDLEAAAEEQQAAEAAAQAMQADGFASPALQQAGDEFGTGALLVAAWITCSI